MLTWGDDDILDDMYAGFDALADLMTEHAKDRRRHNKELFDEQRDAQRGARDAYDQGRFEERSSREEW